MKNQIRQCANNQYILYAGTSIYYDEISDLKRYSYAMNKTNLKKNKIKYLPHPFRTIPKKFRKKISKHSFDKNVQLIDGGWGSGI